MTRTCYVPRNFKPESLRLIRLSNRIIAEYSARGLSLSLRQLYYQLVTKNVIPNSQRAYNRLGNLISNARMAGLVDWEAIEDRTRGIRGVWGQSSPEEALRTAAMGFTMDLWASQDTHVEVWIEKDALTGVLQRVCSEYRVGLFACRGYTSQSEQWRAGRRFSRLHWQMGKRIVVLHMGDHDPSGIDMTRDNRDRLQLFSNVPVTVRRLALSREQVEIYDPPPNPAKETDSRFEAYQKIYGDSSWELDALDPDVIDGLVRSQLEGIVDWSAWERAKAEEDAHRADLRQFYERYDDIRAYLARG